MCHHSDVKQNWGLKRRWSEVPGAVPPLKGKAGGIPLRSAAQLGEQRSLPQVNPGSPLALLINPSSRPRRSSEDLSTAQPEETSRVVSPRDPPFRTVHCCSPAALRRHQA